MSESEPTPDVEKILSALTDRAEELINYIEPAINNMTKDKSFRRVLWMGVVEAAKLKVAQNV